MLIVNCLFSKRFKVPILSRPLNRQIIFGLLHGLLIIMCMVDLLLS